MENQEMKAAIEAILFAVGDSVEISKLAEVLEADKKQVREVLGLLKEDYGKEDRGLDLIELDGAVQLCTKNELYDYLIKIAKAPKKLSLTESVLETLSIIAYKQPVTRAEVENIRGVNSDYPVNRLLEFGLIKELGRKDAPGKPLLFGTTEQFLRSFGVKSLQDLPEINPLQVEEFKMEAEEEARQSENVEVKV
ncbi:MAG: SMC-Scp complex subunit ScpB [Lachnospiraceae bacterium]|nr:SMC-Scp complex subunit ScpB [Lachnospiraceae bacterium]